MGYYENSAWSIYCNSHKMDSKEYIDVLRNSVYREIQAGECRLIEELCANPLKSGCIGYYVEFEIPLLPLIAIKQALDALENRSGFPNLGGGIEVAPSEILTWSYFTHLGVNRYTAKVNTDQLRSLINRYRQLCAGTSKTAFSMGTNPGGTSAGSDKKVEKTLEKNRKEADRILERARTEANKIIETARQNRDRSINEATNSVNRILEDAQSRAASTHAKAKTEAEWTIKEAQREAEQIRLAAQKEAARIKRSAEDDAEGIRKAASQQAEEEAERNAASLIQQKLSGHIQELRRNWEEDQRENAEQRIDTSTLAAALKEDACTVSTTVGANLNRSLDQLQEQINQLRSGVTLDLQQWRSSLYQCEYGKLVNFYNTLNGYANSFEREYREAECSGNVSEELKKILGEHSRKLTRLRSNLVGAMEPMGLRLFTPQEGDLFNSYYHATNEDEDDDIFLDHEIVRCLKPGVERVVNDREVAVLLRASVEVRKD